MEKIQILLIIASFLLSVGWFGYRKTCPYCHRWNGLKRINSDYARTETKYRTENVTITKKDQYGRITGTFEKQESVPYSVSYYKVTYRCKRCNREIQRTIRNGKYLKEAAILFIVCLIILFKVFNPETHKIAAKKKDGLKSQNNIDNYLKNNSNPSDLSIKEIPSKKNSPNKSQPQTLSETNEKTTNVVSSQKESSENTSIDIKQIDKQVLNKQIIITEETPDYLKRELALKMLTEGKSIHEIADSTFLAKKEIRKIKRSINKKKLQSNENRFKRK